MFAISLLRLVVATVFLGAFAGGDDSSNPRIYVEGFLRRVDWLPSNRVLNLPFRIESFGAFWDTCEEWSIRLEVPQIHLSQQSQLNYSTSCDICVMGEDESTAACSYPIYHLTHGLHYRFELSLLDLTEEAISYAEAMVWLRSMRRPPQRDLPDCWLMDQPIDMQDEDCVWLWGALRSTSSIHLSRHEIGHRGVGSGTWGPLLDGTFRDAELQECLPEVSFATQRVQSCAVVGNAWYLADSSLGAEIDGHEAVIRLNRAPVQGFEADVGARTTHRLINSGVEMGELLGSEFDDAILIFRIATLEDIHRLLAACRDSPAGLPLALSPAFLELAHTELLGVLYHTLSERATSGLLALAWAMHHCTKIRTYGFGGGAKLLPQDGTDAEGRFLYQGPAKHPVHLWGRYSYYSQKHFTEDQMLPELFAYVHTWDDEALLLNRLVCPSS